MDIWFTSDTHYHHARVIEYSKRPYEDVNEMNEAMIANYNSVVRPGDLVYHLGDFSFGTPEQSIKIAKRLMGQKYLVFGNHDKRLRKEPEFLSQWIWGRDYAEIKVGDQKIILCHYPFLTWAGSHRWSWSLHGHCHGSLPVDKHALRTDVGVDCFNYFPVNFDEIKGTMSKREFRPVDHHGAKEEA